MTDEVRNLKSQAETMKHIVRVQELMGEMIENLYTRALLHDRSKLEETEAQGFADASYNLSSVEYGSPEYEASKRELQETLEHHYRRNSHHPEHYEEGINGMDLLDLIEMLCDWKASGERTKDGSIHASISTNSKRFEMSEQLTKIFRNTATRMF